MLAAHMATGTHGQDTPSPLPAACRPPPLFSPPPPASPTASPSLPPPTLPLAFWPLPAPPPLHSPLPSLRHHRYPHRSLPHRHRPSPQPPSPPPPPPYLQRRSSPKPPAAASSTTSRSAPPPPARSVAAQPALGLVTPLPPSLRSRRRSACCTLNSVPRPTLRRCSYRRSASVFYYVMEFAWARRFRDQGAAGRGQIHFHLLGWLESGEPHHIISVGNSRDSVVVTPLE